MLRKDTSAAFIRRGFGPLSQFRFEAAGLEARKALTSGAYQRLKLNQATEPVEVLYDEARRRRWWMFQDEYYWEEDGLESRQVKALLLERQISRDRRLRRALAVLDQTSANPLDRIAIADEVKVFVWNRDGGACVRCRSNERLEFDHIIPVASGGSSTARNLQLLCETCNRQKGASLI